MAGARLVLANVTPRSVLSTIWVPAVVSSVLHRIVGEVFIPGDQNVRLYG